MIQEELLPTENDVRFYEENGYWISPKILENDFIQRCIAEMEKVYNGEYETGKEPWGGRWTKPENPYAVWKMDQSHWSNQTLRALATYEMVGAIAARLHRTDSIRLWHDQLLFKPGQKGQEIKEGNVGWHQDNNYWLCAPDTLLTGWAALVDVDMSNGCMQVVPGSHKWGRLAGDFFNQDLESLKADIEQKVGHKFETVPLEMKAGQVSFHHCLTIHGSGRNNTEKPRRSMAIHLQPGDATYIAGTACDNHMNAILMRELGRGNGALFEGDLWPQLYPATAT